MSERTQEPQYQVLLTLRDTIGIARLGLMTNQLWHEDPRHLTFLLSRYKFVSKMLSGKGRVLEVGCGDAFGSRVVQQEVGSLCAIDFDPIFIEDIQSRMNDRWRFDCRLHNILSGPVAGPFDAAYTLDVIEHIPATEERRFVGNIAASLVPDGVLLVGTPSLQSQVYASKYSKEGHVNCKDHKALKGLMQEYFQNVFIFSMNDEVVHTGFYPMAHYLFALCVGRRGHV
jgi:2-polyprenyl-3-methyl-5-hydroxy-6-metoxy-1,4-benzoquinol methylase